MKLKLKNHGTMSPLIMTCEIMYFHAEGVDPSKYWLYSQSFGMGSYATLVFHQGHSIHALYFLFCYCFVSVWLWSGLFTVCMQMFNIGSVLEYTVSDQDFSPAILALYCLSSHNLYMHGRVYLVQ